MWQEGGEAVAALLVVGALGLGGLVAWLVRRRKPQVQLTLIDPDLFRSKHFRIGISQQMMQQIALGGTMIAIPLFLQMGLEYDAMATGLSLAPLSLSMFGVTLLAAKRGGDRRPSSIVRAGFALLLIGMVALLPIVPRAESGWYLIVPLLGGRLRLRPVGVPVEQLHAGADQRGTDQRGGRRELGRRLVRAVVRLGVRRRDHARRLVLLVHEDDRGQRRAAPGRQAADRRRSSRTTPSW